MYPTQTAQTNVPIKESPIFSSISRINSKLDSLVSILTPIIQQKPEKVQETVGGTQLQAELLNIESRITLLLDSINL